MDSFWIISTQNITYRYWANFKFGFLCLLWDHCRTWGFLISCEQYLTLIPIVQWGSFCWTHLMSLRTYFYIVIYDQPQHSHLLPFTTLRNLSRTTNQLQRWHTSFIVFISHVPILAMIDPSLTVPTPQLIVVLVTFLEVINDV